VNYSKPKRIVGDRVMILSDCKHYCITKKDGVYEALAKCGNVWKGLGESKDPKQAKLLAEEHLKNK